MLVQGQGVPCHNYYTRSIWSGLVLLGELWEFAHSGTQARIVIYRASQTRIQTYIANGKISVYTKFVESEDLAIYVQWHVCVWISKTR